MNRLLSWTVFSCLIFSNLACTGLGDDATYSETISGNTRTLSANGCTNYFEVVINPNTATEKNREKNIPAYPMLSGTEISLGETGADIGLTFNGVAIFSCYGGPNYGECSDWDSSAVKAEGDTFDWCGGHSAGGGNYHYHVPPTCLEKQIGEESDGSSPQLGWSYDGFPVYGPKGPGGVRLKICGTTGADSTYCTDSCGGYAGSWATDEFTYRYFFLGDDTDQSSNPTDPLAGEEYFPHTQLCFKGCCPDGVTCSHNLVPSCSGSATEGTTDSYTAIASDPWDGASTLPTYEIPNCLEYPSGYLGTKQSECGTVASSTPTPSKSPNSSSNDSASRFGLSFHLLLLVCLGLMAWF